MDLVDSRSQAILDFWFGSPVGPYRQQWFRKNSEFDDQIKVQFMDVYWAMLASSPEKWLKTSKASLARIIVLDQFARNIFRGTPQSFAADPQALATAEMAIEQGYDAQMLPVERFFLYLPFEHSEQLPHQHRSVEYFESLVLDQPDLAHGLDYARRHRDVIAQFGRFPHRNEILGRQSTEAELAFLKQPGSRF
ncbi:DUF924 family protein [Leptothoe spongobia]|uniref:DUF924 domain-containing protein n=1 Tax=Leptothoe spongobia TAU-MAC 1115 TaxID=1967444 RepID=A0A947DCF2_9CYAN|nr:DUF924 family protein [Leptothoe spongobia]MBT9313924.1 DUF924 domain-containing protein [Leptothoe spongobia TAU-MAC 1115]